MDPASLCFGGGSTRRSPNIKGLSPDPRGSWWNSKLPRSETDHAGGGWPPNPSVALSLLGAGRFSHDPTEQALLWKIRPGLLPSVGAIRKRGSTVLIEDVVFPVADWECHHRSDPGGPPGTVTPDAILFGHAKDGNLHLILTQSFNTGTETDRYARFMDDLARLVVERYDGALKGEHGTGRNMAPFVETEWGPEAYAIMQRLKVLVDPEGLLKSGRDFNPNPKAHLADLKSCPGSRTRWTSASSAGIASRSARARIFTLTPRQRIVVRREMVRLAEGGGDRGLAQALGADFPYMALDTCAVDGLCATACPLASTPGI